MLRKFLTTIVVLAATTAAWADGYSYTLDKDNTRATISADADSENTIDDVITAIKGLSPKVQYVILPDGMTKEQVNAIGASFDATVSKNEATQTETKWVYTWNEKEVVFEGNPTTIDGKPTATVKVLVPLTETKSSYQLYGSPYEGTVFFDAEGKCYGVSNETSDIFSLTKSEGYTYNNGATEYTGKVAESEDKYYGVINPTSEVALRLNQPVSYTYNLNYNNSITYAHFGEVYNNNTMVFWQGGTEYPLTTETRYTYDNGSKLYPENGLTRTADNKTYGWVGGTQVNLTQKDVLYDTGGKLYTDYVREDNGTIYGAWFSASYQLTKTEGYTYKDDYNNSQLYTAKAIRTADGKIYGNTGTPSFNVTLKEDAYTYKPNSWTTAKQIFSGLIRKEGETAYGIDKSNASLLYTTETAPWTYDNGKYIYEGEYISGTNGNVGGTFYELQQTNTATAETPVYTYYSSGIQYYYDGEVTGEGNEWYMQYYGTVDGSKVQLTNNTSGEYKYYTKDGKNIIYTGTVYTKLDGTGEYACEGGTAVSNVAPAAENVNYYTDSDNKKVVYNGDIYYSQENENERWAKTNSNVTPYTLTQEKVYVKDDQTLYTGNVYTEEGKLVGFENGKDVELTYGTIYLKTSDNTLYTGNVYHAQGNAEEYWGGAGTEFVATSDKAWFYTPDGGEETQYTAGIYNDGENTVGFVGGEEKTLTHGEVKYYTKDEQTVIATDKSRISLDGDTYCEGGSAVLLQAKDQDYTANLYTDVENRSVIYTGKVYGDATGYIGGSEIELAYGDIYKKEDATIYTGYRNEENTMGCQNAQALTTLFTYEYVNPNTGETATLESVNHLTTYEVDYTVTVEQKEVETPTGKIHIIAYVSIPGSLYFAIGDKWYGGDDLTALTLSGSLNYADIGNLSAPLAMNKYGHAKYDTYSYDPETNTTTKTTITPGDDVIEGAVENTNCVFTNVKNLQYVDFSDAKFNVNTDMQITAGMTYSADKIKTVYLPTDPSFTHIPAGCLEGAKGVTEICIPKNIKVIDGKAFFLAGLSHIYTTSDDEDIIVDYGPNTITLPAGLEDIRSTGDGGVSTFSGSGMIGITDVYVLAETAPKCAPYSFQGSMTFGNNGFEGNWAHPIGRHIYKNGTEMISVLHYPSICTDAEAEKYTDLDRKYTLSDETGAVDGDGRLMVWPRHAQFWRSFRQAVNGHVWYDWKEYANEGDNEVVMEMTAGVVSDNVTGYDRAYQGWHEFVLVGNSRARDFDPQKENREYIQRDWYTICVPYDLTRSQLLNMLGIVDSDDNETVYMLEENNGMWGVSETSTAVSNDIYPDVRALTHVSRDVNENGSLVSGIVTLHLSEPLISVDENGTVTCRSVVINENGQGFTCNDLDGEDPVVMEGGHAYLIRPYVPKAWNEDIKNLGMYIMAMAESYNNAAKNDGQAAPYNYNEDCKFEDMVYLPCFKHKIHAVKGNGSPNASARYIPEFVYEDADEQSPAYYRFVGTYTQTTVPQYAYYLGKNKNTGQHQFFRTTKETTKWNPFSAVIVGLSDNPDYAGLNTTGQTGIQSVRFVADNENDLKALAGEVSNPSNAGKSLSFEQSMGDANGEATGIVDVNVSENVNVNDNKVYSINGQYMGTSLNNLPKGIYIINGQKKVVK